MGHIRIEMVEDAKTGMIMAEAFGADGAMIANSQPIYRTLADAEAEVTAALRRAWPDRAPDAVDPTLGV